MEWSVMLATGTLAAKFAGLVAKKMLAIVIDYH
jgi:hypothetical protein